MVLTATVGCAFGALAASLTGGWQAMPVEINGATDLTKCLPESGEWKPGNFGGVAPQAPKAKKGNLLGGEYNCWFKTAIDVPAEDKGKSVYLQFGLNFVHAVVFVNGKEAGVAYCPDGGVEISPFLNYGGKNELKIFISNCGFGTGEKITYAGRDDCNPAFGQLGFNCWGTQRKALELKVQSANWVETAWVNPSWRKKELEVFALVHSLAGGSVKFGAQVTEDQGGAAVKNGETEVKLRKGVTKVKLVIPWQDPVCWELVPNAHLYRCGVSLAGGNVPAPFLFGFREIWREGKDIMMNGHVQRFRGFWNQGAPKDMNDLHKFGYNLSYETHQHQGIFDIEPKRAEEYSRAGIARFVGLPSIYSIHGWTKLVDDENCLRQWKRHLDFWMKTARNWPCIVAASCGVNQMCPSDNMIPGILAERYSENPLVPDINLACRTAREKFPNCLYFSHADGTHADADFSSSNLYFNFTPLQEREEWMSSWAENGIRPWYAAEFGCPYYACWFHSRVPQPVEWLSIYYGERAYEEEPVELMMNYKAFAKDCRNKVHGGWVSPYRDLYSFFPLMEEYSRMLVYRTNRAWRSYGQNGGMMYLTSWPWDKKNTMCDRQRQANGRLVTYLGGAPKFTDRTHAYRAGEKISKQLMFCWDGAAETKATAAWRFLDAEGKVLTSGTKAVTLKPGDIKGEMIEVAAPDVKAFARYRFEVTFDSADLDETTKTDSFPVEVYPAALAKVDQKGAKVGVCDPDGLTAAWMAELGVTFTKFDTFEAALKSPGLTHLVVGRRALNKVFSLEAAQKAAEKGLRIWVGAQTPGTWEALGFKVEDSMPRLMFNVALDGVEAEELAHWRGLPLWETEVDGKLVNQYAGGLMKHNTQRGPRWMHTHALGGLAILIPNKAGFRPLVRGEFDNSYSMLVEAQYGAGSALFCSFDFETRVGAKGCPAATAVAAAAMRHFLTGTEEPARKLLAAGATAERLLVRLGADYAKYDGGKIENAVLVAGGDAELAYDALKAKLGANGSVYALANAKLAEAAGCKLEDRQIQRLAKRAELKGLKVTRDVGGALTRWREPLNFKAITGGAANLKRIGEGLFAETADGKWVFDMVNPFQLCDRYRKTADQKTIDTKASGGWGVSPQSEEDLYLRSAAQTEENDLRRVALMLGNLGVRAGAKTFARSIYASPCPGGVMNGMLPIGRCNVLGPWPCEKDQAEKELDRIFPVQKDVIGDSGELAEEMTIRGDAQPNPRFHPVGVQFNKGVPNDLRFVDWRPTWFAQQTGMFCIDWMPSSAAFVAPCVWYAIGRLPRSFDSTAAFRFQCKDAGKLWVNGKEVARSVNNQIVEVKDVPVYANGHQGDGVFEGVNVVSMKIVTYSYPKQFMLQISREQEPASRYRKAVPELDEVDLYVTVNPQFDPYEYIYW